MNYVMPDGNALRTWLQDQPDIFISWNNIEEDLQIDFGVDLEEVTEQDEPYYQALTERLLEAINTNGWTNQPYHAYAEFDPEYGSLTGKITWLTPGTDGSLIEGESDNIDIAIG